MKLTQTHILFVILVMVSLMGQTFASNAMGCVNQASATSLHDMSMMKHHGMMEGNAMQIMSELETNNQSMDCCEKQCKCPANGCSNLVFISLHTLVSDTIIKDQSSTPFFLLPPSKSTSSLYRPPIS